MPEPYPFYSRVPTDRRENLLWRLAVCRRAQEDAGFADDIRQMCARDPLFFINAVCWVFEPRNEPPKSRILPFIMWPDQLEAAKVILSCWGKKPVVIVKSRTQGASWLLIALERWSWLFQDMFTCGITSKDEESVDTKDDMSTLMPKMDWIVEQLPEWLKPKKVQRTDLKSVNVDRRCVTKGYAATGDAGRSGRTFVWIKDESAAFPKNIAQKVNDSIGHVTNCQIDISTPQGDVGPFFERAHDENITKVVLDWKNNPTNNRGLYEVTRDREIRIIDPVNNPMRRAYRDKLEEIHFALEQKGFKVEGTVRSEFYNDKCLEMNPVSIAQELDMSFGKSAEKAFERDTINLLVERHARKPVQVGRVKVDDHCEAEFQAIKGGQSQLWCPLGGPDQRPPKRHYGAGVDLSQGTGGAWSSNSVLIVGDVATGEQVFELVTSAVRPADFARICVAVCKWFWNAVLNWDSMGPGVTFGKEAMERWGYSDVVYSPTQETGPGRTPGRSPGTHRHSPEEKALYLSNCIEDALTDRLIIRSAATLLEFAEFGFRGGNITHLRAERTQSEAEKGKSHGDRAIACAMWNMVRRELCDTTDPVPDRPPGPNEPLREVSWPCAANRILAHRKNRPSKLVWY